ncbi:hypothetical protein M404DRAFT_24696 [Pisolithus tinctorius Marx 270]|uniref:Uncharacterized protein n=1 Tax=Pisolithus tinctorius Marx 270 TaxID=870435 RepID=A0A0C3PF11_PISTI|nr:hypothetical protein M404DRAFT_24696 [Pisolithus tinctorius Marx 270]
MQPGSKEMWADIEGDKQLDIEDEPQLNVEEEALVDDEDIVIFEGGTWITHKKLNRMDGSSTPAQDITMQVNFLEDLQNVQEPSPLPITHESSNLRD